MRHLCSSHLLWILLTAITAQKSFCREGEFCVYGQTNGNSITFTVFSSYDGWFSFGIGTSMLNTPMYVGWLNSTGLGVAVSAYSTGQQQPTASVPQDISLLPVQLAAPSWSRLSYSFTRLLNQPKSSLSTTSSYVFAYSNIKVSNPDSITTASYAQHLSFGVIENVDLVSSGNTSIAVGQGGPIFTLPSGWSFDNLYMAHGILMFIAWGILPYVAIFSAVYLKHLGNIWFLTHKRLFTAVFVISLISFLLVFLFRQSAHFNDVHSVFGLLVLLGTVAQIALGYYIDSKYNPERSKVPFHDTLHCYVGRAIVCGSIVTLFLGLKFYGSGIALYILLSLWIMSLSLLFFMGKRLTAHFFPSSLDYNYTLQHS